MVSWLGDRLSITKIIYLQALKPIYHIVAYYWKVHLNCQISRRDQQLLDIYLSSSPLHRGVRGPKTYKITLAMVSDYFTCNNCKDCLWCKYVHAS